VDWKLRQTLWLTWKEQIVYCNTCKLAKGWSPLRCLDSPWPLPVTSSKVFAPALLARVLLAVLYLVADLLAVCVIVLASYPWSLCLLLPGCVMCADALIAGAGRVAGEWHTKTSCDTVPSIATVLAIVMWQVFFQSLILTLPVRAYYMFDNVCWLIFLSTYHHWAGVYMDLLWKLSKMQIYLF
jgi:hypothetical protein